MRLAWGLAAVSLAACGVDRSGLNEGGGTQLPDAATPDRPSPPVDATGDTIVIVNGAGGGLGAGGNLGSGGGAGAGAGGSLGSGGAGGKGGKGGNLGSGGGAGAGAGGSLGSGGAGSGGNGNGNGNTDAGADADTGVDLGLDVRTDAGSDAGLDGRQGASGGVSGAGGHGTGGTMGAGGADGGACPPCAPCERCGAAGACEIDPDSLWDLSAVAAVVSAMDPNSGPSPMVGGPWDGPAEPVGGPLPDPFCQLEMPTGMPMGTTATITDSLIPNWAALVPATGAALNAPSAPLRAGDLLAGGKPWRVWVGDDDVGVAGATSGEQICEINGPLAPAAFRAGTFGSGLSDSCISVTFKITCRP